MSEANGSATPEKTRKGGRTGNVVNRLDDRQRFTLCAYVMTHRDRMEKATGDDATRELSENVGAKYDPPFKVTIDNAIRAFKTVGAKFRRTRTYNVAGIRAELSRLAEVPDRLAAVELATEQFTRQLAEPAANLTGLNTRLGELETTVRAIHHALALLASGMKRAANRYPELRPFFESAGMIPAAGAKG
jgi:hypothetical protein